MKFPTLCVDDFYKNPKQIRDYALSLNYNKDLGIFPGERTKYLHEINPGLFEQFCCKLFSLFFNFSTENCSWRVESRFQKTYQISDDPTSVCNSGWDHLDGNIIAAGIIYLNEKPTPNSGTTISRLKTEKDTFDFSMRDRMYKTRDIDLKDYEKSIRSHKEFFEDTIEFKNVFNRMVCYDSSQWHRETSLFYEHEPRLTQVFFIHHVESNTFPIERCMSYEL